MPFPRTSGWDTILQLDDGRKVQEYRKKYEKVYKKKATIVVVIVARGGSARGVGAWKTIKINLWKIVVEMKLEFSHFLRLCRDSVSDGWLGFMVATFFTIVFYALAVDYVMERDLYARQQWKWSHKFVSKMRYKIAVVLVKWLFSLARQCHRGAIRNFLRFFVVLLHIRRMPAMLIHIIIGERNTTSSSFVFWVMKC